MPRFFCDYCDAYLTHDSAPGRQQHIRGWKHRENFKQYYMQFFPQFMQAQQAQAMMNQFQMPPPPMFGMPPGQPPPFLPFRPPPGAPGGMPPGYPMPPDGSHMQHQQPSNSAPTAEQQSGNSMTA
ncbi:unnamed protein product [Symbiodinium microadriaticum]|nr:unnamed protein product [Symbiodinium microadriaticum]